MIEVKKCYACADKELNDEVAQNKTLENKLDEELK